MEHKYGKALTAALALLFCAASSPVALVPSYADDVAPGSAAEKDAGAAEKQEMKSSEVTIDADTVNYSEKTGIATADGNVRIRNSEIYLTAPYVEYDSQNNVADAYSDHRENVVIVSGGNT